jgi:acetolactate synthase I/II/III large subunit
VVVDMLVDQNKNVYPMIPAGAAHNEVILNPAGRNDGKFNKNQV